MKRTFFLILAALVQAEPPDGRLKPALDEILAEPAIRNAVWGVMVYDLANQTTLYARNEDLPFIPASNTKLFATALALTRLGPDYHFETRVFYEPGSRTLTLSGSGDPALTIEEGIDDLADQVREAGIQVVGDIVGDESLYAGSPYADGWTVDDVVWDYGAPASALTVNENTLHLTLVPGDPMLMAWKPTHEFYSVVHSIEMKEGKPELLLQRPGNSFTLFLTGHMTSRPVTLDIAVHDPALFAAQSLAAALRAKGVAVQGRMLTIRRPDARQGLTAPPGNLVAWRLSPPLIDLIAACNKRSQNLFAELLLREVGRVVNGESGLRELKAFLAESGVAQQDFNFEDGSGLDRRNLVTPRAIIALLERMHNSLFAEDWWMSLPAPGDEGTMQKRFRRVKDAAAIHAKTGTITHVTALSGYAGLDYDTRIAFAILVNNHTNPTAEIRTAIDKLGTAILKYGAN